MMHSLYIRNYAIIDELEIEWPVGLTVITGETGAGKSILIGALQLVLGNRADVKVLRNPDEKCIVEVLFRNTSTIPDFLREKFEIDDEIMLRREILPNGKSRSFINDSPALLNDIQQFTPYLLNIHQQFDHLDFLDRSYQLSILDTFAGISEQVNAYRKKYKELQDLLQQEKITQEKLSKILAEKEFIAFQYTELENANLKENELTTLENELSTISKSEEIKSNTQQALHLLQGDAGMMDKLHEILGLLKNLRVNEGLQSTYHRFDLQRTELKDLGRDLERIADTTDYSPERINTIQQRIDALNRLLKKHRLQTDIELISRKNELKQQLDAIEASDESLIQLKNKIAELKKEVQLLAQGLSTQRKKKSPELIRRTQHLLIQLGMEFARFDIELNSSAEPMESGTDLIEFLFAANKGTALRPIKDQVSGGELARFNLAIKSQIAQKTSSGCLLFDEIDTGVSGQTAIKMGNILREIAQHQQVICITHSPQVASRTQQHYYVFKEHQGPKTYTRLKNLSINERLHELAKMLSGEPPTKAALKNASELIEMN